MSSLEIDALCLPCFENDFQEVATAVVVNIQGLPRRPTITSQLTVVNSIFFVDLIFNSAADGDDPCTCTQMLMNELGDL